MPDDDWEVVKTFLPRNWRWLAKRTKALKGLRKDKDPEQALRAMLLHLCCGLSLRETAMLARQGGIADMTDVALLKRLRKSREWLRQLCASLLRETAGPRGGRRGREFRVLDSSIVKEPGAAGGLWRIHFSLCLPSLRCDFLRLTPADGEGNGDSLASYPMREGDHVMADRGYSHAAGIRHVADHKAYVCVRVNPSALRLKCLDGKEFALFENLRSRLRRAGAVGEWSVRVVDEDGSSVVGRICALRKSASAIAKAQKKLHRRASKKSQTLKPLTLKYAQYVIVFTTFPETEYSAAAVLEAYRWRWQIELIFKRFKQIARLGHLPKTDSASAESWLYGKLLAALLTQRMIQHARSLSPWGYDLEKSATAQPLA